MKTTLLTLIALAITVFSFGQAPEAFKYQAVVRDAGGVILTNQAVGYQLSILQGSPSGTAVYTETFSPTTNNYGLVNIEIGTGNTVDDFTAIDWANGPYYIETAIDVTGGTSYSVMGTSQMVSVPYALYSKSADSVVNDMVDDADADPNNEIQAISFSNDTLYLSDGGQVYLGAYGIDLVDDADADPNNEIQAISFSNDTLYLSNGGQVYLGAYGIDLVDDADADPNNELQSLSLSNDTLYLSNSNSAYLGGINGGGSSSEFYLGQDTLGGIVYYIYIGSDGNQHGLIVNKGESTQQWQTAGTTTNANRSWDGVYNMSLITNSPAKTYCQGLTDGGFTDWYLPSIDELALLLNNRYHANTALNQGGYTIIGSAYYWTSTENGSGSAFGFRFLFGNTTSQTFSRVKTDIATVRAIRSF